MLALDPWNPDGWNLLGLIAIQSAQLPRARRFITRAARLNPGFSDYFSNLGAAWHRDGHHVAAASALIAAVIVHPGHASHWSGLADAWVPTGRKGAAHNAYRRSLVIEPSRPETLSNYASLLDDLGEPDRAAAAFRAALCLDPILAPALNNLGNRLHAASSAGLALLRRSAVADPSFSKAYSNLGNALTECGQSGSAEAACRIAVILDPPFAEAHCNLGNALLDRGLCELAEQAYRRALAIRPKYPKALGNLGNALKDLGRHEEAAATYAEALRQTPDFAEIHSNLILALHYSSKQDSVSILAEAKRFGRQFDLGLSRPRPRSSDPDRQLRIGFISGDLRQHPVGFFLLPALLHRSAAEAEIFLYSTNRTEDSLTGRLRNLSNHWRSLVALGDDAAAALIATDGIDILVDLSGHTALNRLPLFSRRPAPIQMSWLGYWNTTGLPAMDYLLSDAATLPPEHDTLVTEKPVRLPGGRFCYSPPHYAPAPQRLGTWPGATFGSFNNLAKVGPDTIALWSEILLKAPESRMIIKWQSLCELSTRRALGAGFASHGVDPRRIEMRGASSHEKMLAEYGEIDIALDPHPFSGGLTSCEALWMGVPVVTLVGAGPHSRQSFSFLSALGMQKWAAFDRPAYIATALALAAEGPRSDAARIGLRNRMAASSLCDAASYTRHLEATFRSLWRTYLASSG